nr:hypothetical protein [Tanacetum cinerariifolium]
MNPLTAQQERKARKDHGMRRGRHFTSSSSTFDQPSSSHLNDDDDGNDEGTSRASTPSLIHFVNSLTNEVLKVFQNPPNIDPYLEPFYTRQTEIFNRQVQIQDEHRGGLRSIRKGLRNLWRNIKKRRLLKLGEDMDQVTQRIPTRSSPIKGIHAAGLSLIVVGSRLMLLSKADTTAEDTEGITLKGDAAKKADVQAGGHENILKTQEYVKKVNEYVSEDDHFTQGPWLMAIVYLHAQGVIASGCLGDVGKY